jgi:hypothetical protein
MSQSATPFRSSRSHRPRKGAVRVRSQPALARQRHALRRKSTANKASVYGTLSAWERCLTTALTLLIGVELLQALWR